MKYALLAFLFSTFAGISSAQAATLSVSPSGGTFSVGSTYNVSILLNTEGESINVIDIGLRFPSDKIQLISPSTGQSIVEVWTSPPRFNNQKGEIKLQGGIPGGINVSRGLVTNLTFRVKQVGTATLRFEDVSRVLLNDGKGTDVLKDIRSGIYDFVLPPPAGPLVVSETHPDSALWYPNPNVVFRWEGDPAAQGYSYEVSDNPVDLPDDISEGIRTGITYRSLSDGVHYFHIKSLRGGSWGGITHFAFNIDTTPPAEFPIEISPRKRTTRPIPIISWETTDKYSGLDHYEIKLIKLSGPPSSPSDSSESQSLFIEATSPYTPTLGLGKYDVVIRAYDKAGNYQEEKEKIEVVQAFFQIVSGEGIRVTSRVTVSWLLVGLIGFILIGLLGFLSWHAWRWHRKLEGKIAGGALQDPVISARLAELKEGQARNAKSLAIFLLLITLSWGSLDAHVAEARELQLSPPLVTLVSENITNEELFYIGGKSEIPGGEIVIYLQNTQTGETLNLKAPVDKTGNWFYSHSQFLPSGQYILWAQNKSGEELSAPSPQVKITATQTAIQFGSSRLSYETLYLIFSLILLVLVLGLLTFIGFHTYHGRKKHFRFRKEMQEVEEAIRRGLAVLRRDIEAELAVVNKVKLSKTLAEEEDRKEKQLLQDLEWIEKEIGKEILDVEHLE